MNRCSKCGNLSDSKFCPECGAEMLANDEMKMPKNENDKNQDETSASGEEKNRKIHETNLTKPKGKEWYKRDWFVILMLIVFFPFGLFLMWKYSKWNKMIKIIVTVAIGLMLMIGMAIGDNNSESYDENSPQVENSSSEEVEDTGEAEEESNQEVFTTETDYTDVSYDSLARTPEPYTNTKVKGTGTVIQVLESGGETELRIAINGDYNKVILLYYDSSLVTSRILEDDYVTYYGISYGLYTYESTMGGDITVPLIEAQKIVQ